MKKCVDKDLAEKNKDKLLGQLGFAANGALDLLGKIAITRTSIIFSYLIVLVVSALCFYTASNAVNGLTQVDKGLLVLLSVLSVDMLLKVALLSHELHSLLQVRAAIKSGTNAIIGSDIDRLYMYIENIDTNIVLRADDLSTIGVKRNKYTWGGNL